MAQIWLYYDKASKDRDALPPSSNIGGNGDLVFDTNLVKKKALLYFLDWSFDTTLGLCDSALTRRDFLRNSKIY